MLLMRELRIACKSRIYSLGEIGVKSVYFKSWSDNQRVQGMVIVRVNPFLFRLGSG